MVLYLEGVQYNTKFTGKKSGLVMLIKLVAISF